MDNFESFFFACQICFWQKVLCFTKPPYWPAN